MSPWVRTLSNGPLWKNRIPIQLHRFGGHEYVHVLPGMLFVHIGFGINHVFGPKGQMHAAHALKGTHVGKPFFFQN